MIEDIEIKEKRVDFLNKKIESNREEINRLLHVDWKNIEVLHIRITMLSDLNKQYIEELRKLNG